jgi:DNA-binding NtrC family response regulator
MKTMARILVVDDERQIRDIVTAVLSAHGHAVIAVESAAQALQAVTEHHPDLTVCDLMLPDINGVELLRQLRERRPQIGCIFMTAYGSIRSAVDAIRAGADEYLTKPFDNDDLLLAIERLIKVRRLTHEVETLRAELNTRYGFTDIIGVCPKMQEVFRLMSRVAGVDATVLILGESGTGKELVARGIHRRSRRAAGPFIPVNCGAIPTTLIESAFFGHEKGAFTDARESHAGWFEQANGGTLFLDEVGDLPLDAQTKLLRVLQDSHVTRLSGRKPIRVDVRVLAATNRDLERAIESGQFRQDLYWRLNVLALRLPALRERSQDLPLLIDALLERLDAELGLGIKAITDEARGLLLAHDWPGNVRELENTLRGSMIVCDGPTVSVKDLPPRIRGEHAGAPLMSGSVRLTLAEAVDRAVERVERSMIHAALSEHNGNRTLSAESLGVNRKTLFNKMRDYGMAANELESDEN